MRRQNDSETVYEIAYPRGGGRLRPAREADGIPPSPVSAVLTRPAAGLYQVASSLLASSRLRSRRRLWTDLAVVSIGNLEIGGSGKTPFALHLLDELVARGHRPVYVSRGYKSEAETIRPVTVVLPDGVSLEDTAGEGDLRVVSSRGPLLSRAIGDEGAMVAMRRPDVPLLFCADKSRAIATAHLPREINLS